MTERMRLDSQDLSTASPIPTFFAFGPRKRSIEPCGGLTGEVDGSRRDREVALDERAEYALVDAEFREGSRPQARDQTSEVATALGATRSAVEGTHSFEIDENDPDRLRRAVDENVRSFEIALSNVTGVEAGDRSTELVDESGEKGAPLIRVPPLETPQ
jgi:hypothetical protein